MISVTRLLECIHCYANAARRKFSGELTTAEARGMIEDLASFRVPALLISGGEPLVRHDILDLAQFLGVSATIEGKAYAVSAETLEPSQVSFIDRDSFLRFLASNAEALRCAAMA